MALSQGQEKRLFVGGVAMDVFPHLGVVVVRGLGLLQTGGCHQRLPAAVVLSRSSL